MLRNMRILILATVAAFAAPGMASACPDLSSEGDATFEYSARELLTGESFDVVAGGNERLDNCSIESGSEPTGFVQASPDFEFYLSGMQGYGLTVGVVADCDSVLLINTANGNWFFDDDDGRDEDARITLTRPSEGLYDVWVGTYGSEACDARLYVATEGEVGA